MIKQHVQFKASQWPEFNKSLKELVDAKRAEIIRALSGRGQYRLKAKYSYIGIDQTEWQKKRPDQRKAIIKRLDECTLIVNEWLQCNNTPSTSHIHLLYILKMELIVTTKTKN